MIDPVLDLIGYVVCGIAEFAFGFSVAWNIRNKYKN